MSRLGNTTVLHASIPTPLYKELKESAVAEERSLSKYISILLREARLITLKSHLDNTKNYPVTENTKKIINDLKKRISNLE